MPAPKAEEGRLVLLESWWKSSAAAGPPVNSKAEDPLPRRVEISWTVIMNTGSEGMGLAWLDTSKHGDDGVPKPMSPEESRDPGGNFPPEGEWGWEAPNLRSAFGVGLDASNPVNRDPFRGSGNANDRPQHEMSLHFDGLEINKRTTRTEFRDGEAHKVSVMLDFVTGGGEVTVQLDDEAVFERVFIPGMTAFRGRAVFGARNSATAGDVAIDDVAIETTGRMEPPQPPRRVMVFDRVLNDASHGSNAAEVELPDKLEDFGRIIATLRLDKPEKRFDPWDRIARVWIEDLTTGVRHELLRYITPYHRGYEWKIDVSDFRPMLSGKKRLVQECGTYGEGWLVSLWMEYFPGPAPGGLEAVSLEPLWCGDPVIGDPENPPNRFYQPKEVAVDGAALAKVRMVVTGHGGLPNTGNAAEFMPIERTLRINGRSTTDRLWKQDCYLNPCRPQGGTWKYDRAGWAPGDVVAPWEVWVSDSEIRSKRLKLEYELAAYTNQARGKGGPPIHVTQSVLVRYRRVGSPDAP